MKSISAFLFIILILCCSCAKELVYNGDDSDDGSTNEIIVYDSKTQSLTFSSTTPGSLAQYISSTSLGFILKSLTIHGEINGEDLLCIREMAGTNITGGYITDTQLNELNLTKCSFINGPHVFYMNKYDSFCINDSKTLPLYAFANCHYLKKIEIPETIEIIEEFSFYKCSQLRKIVIPKSVKQINAAFYTCTKIEEVKCDAPIPPKCKIMSFPSTIETSATLIVPKGSIKKYKNDEVWGKFKKIIE